MLRTIMAMLFWHVVVSGSFEPQEFNINAEAEQFCRDSRPLPACCEMLSDAGDVDCSSCPPEFHRETHQCIMSYISEFNNRPRPQPHSLEMLRIAILSPLHWSVHDLGATQPLTIYGKIHGFGLATPSDMHVNVLLSGFSEIAPPVSSICPLQPQPGPCMFHISIPREMLGTSTLALAARLVRGSDWSKSLKPVAELSFRSQKRFVASWDQDSCWKGFSASTPRYDACLREDRTRTLMRWRSKRREDIGKQEEGGNEESKIDDQHQNPVVSYRDWKDVSADEEKSLQSVDRECQRREKFVESYGRLQLNVTQGGRVGIVLVLRKCQRDELIRFFLSLQDEMRGKSVIAFSDDPPAISAVLYRLSSSFQVHMLQQEAPDDEIMSRVLGQAKESFSILCTLSLERSRKAPSWICSSSSLFSQHWLDTSGAFLRAGDDGNVQSDGNPVSYVLPRLYGLMGNVLFQTAAALTLALDLDEIRFNGRRWKVLLPLPQDHKQCAKTFTTSVFSSFLIDRLDLATLQLDDLLYLDEGTCHICHYNLTQDAISSRVHTNLMIHGWRQSYKYFWHRRQTIIDGFSLPAHLEDVAQYHFRKILGQQEHRQTVSVHIRRGDLLSEQGTLLSLSYYERAVEEFDEDTLFVIFSDDIPWCKSTPLFQRLKHVVFVELGIDFIELRMMSMCDHHIVANSTFSVWAAYLHHTPPWRGRKRKRKTKVVCPKVWGRGDEGGKKFGEGEIYPPSWIRIPNDFVRCGMI